MQININPKKILGTAVRTIFSRVILSLVEITLLVLVLMSLLGVHQNKEDFRFSYDGKVINALLLAAPFVDTCLEEGGTWAWKGKPGVMIGYCEYDKSDNEEDQEL